MILGTVIGGFVLQVGDADNDPAQDITIITDDRSYIDAVIMIGVPVVAFLAREVWKLKSEVEYLKGKLESMEKNDQTLRFDSREIEGETDQGSSKKKNGQLKHQDQEPLN